MNHIVILGHIGSIEKKETEFGSILNMTVATNRSYKKAGERVTETTWHDVKAFGNVADVVAQYFQKGSKIAVEGRMIEEKWQTNEGQQRSKRVIVLENFHFVDPKQEA